MTNRKIQSGYTLLFAVLTASLVLGVAAFVAGIARKQYIISATARDSIYSFYNADSAIECIISSMSSWPSATSSLASVTCNNVTTTLGVFSDLGLGIPSFNGSYKVYENINNISFGLNGSDGCSVYSIKVGYNTDTPPMEKVVIEASGYNVCIEDPTSPGNFKPANSRRTVERTIRLTQ
ncbi:MAG: hypothetical protein WCW03_02525 [Candidatus Paceibacterota bacterium]|jgi:hypothetical protein